jgi:hypothetical protein
LYVLLLVLNSSGDPPSLLSYWYWGLFSRGIKLPECEKETFIQYPDQEWAELYLHSFFRVSSEVKKCKLFSIISELFFV